jgi:acetylornithine deacetylase/succinyl-diaminopimelate desuccinylase-like protein
MADKSSYTTLLREFVAHKSISTDIAFQASISKTVDWLSELFKANGFKVQILKGNSTNPVVLASFSDNTSKETVLIYGHYDVQPADIADGWNHEPFDIIEADNRLIGRGVVDNKGQLAIHMSTIFELIKSGNLKYQIKFLIEGNEETSNPDLEGLITTYKNDLKTNHILVSDGEMLGDRPTIDISLRGGLNLNLKFKTASNNLHSGIYGGAVPSAPWEMVRFLSKIYDSDQRITIPEYYSQVDPITPEQVQNNIAIQGESDKLLVHAGIKRLLAEPNTDFFTQTGLRPTIQITGLKSGYLGDGFANIVPATAEVKLNFRIVASQTAQEALDKFTIFAKNNIPNFVDFTIDPDGMHEPIKANISAPIVSEIKAKLEDAFGKPTVFKNVGGAIPFIADVKKVLGIEVIQVPLGNDDCNMHGANENYSLDLIQKALTFSKSFFKI